MNDSSTFGHSENPNSNPFDPGYFDSAALRRMGFRSVGNHVSIAKNCTIIGLRNVEIGSNVRIDGNVVIAAHTGSLILGNYIHIGGACYLGCAGGIRMDDFSGLSQGVRVYSGSDDYSGSYLTNPTISEMYTKKFISPVRLGRHVIIGSGTVILPGVTIEEGSAVGALSLVTKRLEPWTIYFGNPVKPLKSRRKDLLKLEQQFLQDSASGG